MTNIKLNGVLMCLIGIFFANVSVSYAITDSYPSNNIMNISVNVIETQIPSFSFVHYAENALDDVNDYDALVETQANFTSRINPISDETPFFVRKENDFLQIDGKNINKACDLIRDLEKKVRTSSMNISKLIGVISQSSANKYANGYAGFACSSTSKRSVIVTEKTSPDDYKETSAAHEIGHTYGLCDEYNETTFESQDNGETTVSGNGCPNGDKNEDGLLDSECVDTYGISGLMGCPIANQDLINDFFYSDQNYTLVNIYGSRNSLSTGYRRWINNQTYLHLISQLNGTGKVICTDEELIIVSGNINKSFNMTLDNFYIVKGGCYLNETVGSVPTNATVLRIEQRGIGGTILNFLSRIMDFLIIGDGGEVAEINEMPFIFVMPYDNATTFDFINQSNNFSLAQRNVTPNAPAVNITYPLGGEIMENKFNITWNATDADGDNVYYAVLISDDGGSNYTTLDLDLNQSYYELDPNDYDYGSNYSIKVLATDGVNTGNNVTDLFTLRNPLSISSLQTISSNNAYYVFEFIVLNNGTTLFTDVQWQFDTGDAVVINSTHNTSLAPGGTLIAYVAYNYSVQGEYTVVVNASGVAEGISAVRSLGIGASTLSITGLKALYSNLSEKVFEFAINNSGDSNLSVNWTLNLGDGNVVSSVQNANINSSASLLAYVQHSYASQGDYSVSATAQGGGLTASSSVPVEVEYLGVSNFSVLNSSGALRTFEAYVRNYMTVNMTNVSWSLNTGNGIVSSTSPMTLQPQESAFVFVTYNYTATGSFGANFTAVNSSWNDVESLNVTIT